MMMKTIVLEGIMVVFGGKTDDESANLVMWVRTFFSWQFKFFIKLGIDLFVKYRRNDWKCANIIIKIQLWKI